MKLPLTLFSLYLLLILAGYAFVQYRRPPRARGEQPNRPPLRLGISELMQDTLRVYALFAPAAVLSIALGKPDYLAQWAAWLLWATQLAKAPAIHMESGTAMLLLRLIGFVMLAYMWVINLPYFDVLPT